MLTVVISRCGQIYNMVLVYYHVQDIILLVFDTHIVATAFRDYLRAGRVAPFMLLQRPTQLNVYILYYIMLADPEMFRYYYMDFITCILYHIEQDHPTLPGLRGVFVLKIWNILFQIAVPCAIRHSTPVPFIFRL